MLYNPTLNISRVINLSACAWSTRSRTTFFRKKKKNNGKTLFLVLYFMFSESSRIDLHNDCITGRVKVEITLANVWPTIKCILRCPSYCWPTSIRPRAVNYCLVNISFVCLPDDWLCLRASVYASLISDNSFIN